LQALSLKGERAKSLAALPLTRCVNREARWGRGECSFLCEALYEDIGTCGFVLQRILLRNEQQFA
jgi:hypothetical protein